ncbi:conserved hypothetical protein [Gluconacetobacter diazotrophicus PA1 5]|uniref:hypothetical protein n=1 Tax=Gluconacetobacter diazotrophicus TaxID=33996 RepID=UPI000173BD27|nr:hypothetical protein [Gluconacetobacter diazotrophicus]ACI50606.1 conserved hypothetical protein [Gluconacetobacter diazotrophicus PA1 5]TWB09438.1 hypothetical protein FBZ86_104101 [Gluconacetobacter diazotrophicus]
MPPAAEYTDGRISMLNSTIIEVDGIFLGAAIVLDGLGGRRFYATHDSVRSLHNQTLPDLVVLTHRVAQQFRRARLCQGAL